MKRSVVVILLFALAIGGAVVWRSELIGAEADSAIKDTLALPTLVRPAHHVTKNLNSEPVVNLMNQSQPTNSPSANANVEPTQTNVSANGAPVAASALPAAVNLDVPFTSQAPFGKWDAIHEETCEEADIFMVDKYFKKQKISGPAEADAAILKIIGWEKANLGLYKDTNAAEIARTLTELYGYKNVSLVNNPTANGIKGFLSKGFLVLLPADGKKLLNPNFKNGGPPYHVLLLRGYTADGYWITNDPGTHKGDGFLYPEANLMTAMHDYISGDTAHGAKVVVVIRPN
jgi:hypothetical protein